MSPRSSKVIVAARLLTLGADDDLSRREKALPRAVEVSEGRIVRLLDDDTLRALGKSTERLDLGSATLLPGLCDAHLHLLGLGRSIRQLDLRTCRSPEAVAARVTTATRNSAPGEWIRGRGWDHLRFSPPTWPHRRTLDAVAPDHPVWLFRVDGHAAWLNTLALALAGIDSETPDPAGGAIVRDPAGHPSGVILDNALELAGQALPSRTEEEIDRDLRTATKHCRALGLTSVHDMGTSAATLDRLEARATRDELSLRVVAYLAWEEAKIADGLARGPFERGKLVVPGVKLYCDGALGSHGAAMEAPYTDRPEASGLLLTEPDLLRERTLRAARAGFAVAIHGIGDRGCRLAVDAFEAVRAAGLRVTLRLEHTQILGPGEVKRLARLQVLASVQPTHATSDMGWVERRIGPGRLAGAYPLHSLLDHGVDLALGSDAPIEPANPWFGIHAAVTREDREGHPEGGWQPHERLTLSQALTGFTRGGLRAGAIGPCNPPAGLRPGAPADLCAIDKDLGELPPGDLHRVQCVWSSLGA